MGQELPPPGRCLLPAAGNKGGQTAVFPFVKIFLHQADDQIQMPITAEHPAGGHLGALCQTKKCFMEPDHGKRNVFLGSCRTEGQLQLRDQSLQRCLSKERFTAAGPFAAHIDRTKQCGKHFRRNLSGMLIRSLCPPLHGFQRNELIPALPQLTPFGRPGSVGADQTARQEQTANQPIRHLQ